MINLEHEIVALTSSEYLEPLNRALTPSKIPPNTSKLQYPNMAPLDPPPEAIFDSPETAEAHIQQWAEAHGYAIVRKNHSKDKYGEIRKIWVICDKGGKIRSIKALIPDAVNDPQPQGQEPQDNDAAIQETKPKGRKSGSRKTGCEFMLTITRNSGHKWNVEILNSTHNHEPSL